MDKTDIYFLKKSELKKGPQTIDLPASKSIANRALIVNALSTKTAELKNISVANDTQLMQKLLQSEETELSAEDAGTTMRFLTAYLAVKKKSFVLTGTERMQKRPIGILVDALRKLGAKIEYMKEEGYPPLKINGFTSQKTNKLEVNANISSQYISALMMIGPSLPEGLTLTLSGKIGSRPYIEMTKKVMEAFGAEVNFTDNVIEINGKPYAGTDEYKIEPDWSAASYWYSLIATQKSGSILLKDLPENSIQGDHVIYKIMRKFGVQSHFSNKGAELSYTQPETNLIEYDYTDCPDLAQTVAVAGGALGFYVKMKGLESLKIKETDRISALHDELKKFKIHFIETNNEWEIKPTSPEWPSETVTIETYEDHRMAMAFMPLCSFCSLAFKDPSVVKKSYPHFWKDVESVL